MLHKNSFSWPAIIIILSFVTEGFQNGILPEHLVNCYRYPPRLLPKTMDTLIEIIRKIELAPNFNMDTRMLANVLLHRFRMDGIERDPNIITTSVAVPFHATGFQAYRQQLMFQFLIPGNALNFPNNSLTETEKCTLHWMLSSTVDPWERGDESRACFQSIHGFINSYPQTHGAKMSSCPEEWGVVYEREGTVSPGTVIAAIASALSPQNVQQSQILSNIKQNVPTSRPQIGWAYNAHNETYSYGSVNNTWVATLAGDLAEVIQFQAANVKDIYLGAGGTWNNTYIPSAYYFTSLDSNRIEKKAWQITDAEIIGGVDGLILSSQALKLTNQVNRPRLSQILEMYYSDRGLFFDNDKRACNREMNIANIMRGEKQTLLSQVVNFAELLGTKVVTYSVNNKFIMDAARQAVDRFSYYMSDLMKRTRCTTQPMRTEKINISVAIDQSWPSYTTLQIMMYLSKAIDVSHYGSTISIIHGQTGQPIVNAARNTTEVYLRWTTSGQTEPYELSLPQTLISIKKNVENRIEKDRMKDIYESQGYVTLIMGYSTLITDSDQDKARSLISGIKSIDPDMKFVYATSRLNTQTYVKLTGLPGSQSDRIVVIGNIDSLPSFLTKLQDSLSSVPRKLAAPFCRSNSGSEESVYEEYITPGQPLKYRIHPDYLCGSKELKIKITNRDYGSLQVCKSRSEQASGDYQCHSLKPYEDYSFKITKPCEKSKNNKNIIQWSDTCLPVFLDINVQTTLNKCPENECRYPDQVKFNIVLKGLKCVEPFKTICASGFTNLPEYKIFIFTIFASLYSVYFHF